LVFFSELGFGEKGREIERGFRVGFVEKFDYGWCGYRVCFSRLWKKIWVAYYYYFFNLINADVENCGSSKRFGFIYIYID